MRGRIAFVGVRHDSPDPDERDNRHSPDWCDQSDEIAVLAPGDRMFIACEGGPCRSRAELFPPRLEVSEEGGVYVLDDEGPRHLWRYVFVPNGV